MFWNTVILWNFVIFGAEPLLNVLKTTTKGRSLVGGTIYIYAYTYIPVYIYVHILYWHIYIYVYTHYDNLAAQGLHGRAAAAEAATGAAASSAPSYGPPKDPHCLVLVYHFGYTREARKLEHDGRPTPKQRKQEHQHKSTYIHVSTSRSLLLLGGKVY